MNNNDYFVNKTWEQVHSEFVDYLKDCGYKQTTIYTISSIFRKIVENIEEQNFSVVDHEPAKRFTEEDYDKYFNKLEEDNRTKNFKNNVISSFKKINKFYETVGVDTIDVSQYKMRSTIYNTKPALFKESTVWKICSYTTFKPAKLAVLLIYYSCCTGTTISNIQVSDFNRRTNLLTLIDRNGSIVKIIKLNDMVAQLFKDVVSELSDWIEEVNDNIDKYHNGREKRVLDYVFQSKKSKRPGRQLIVQYVSMVKNNAIDHSKEIGIPEEKLNEFAQQNIILSRKAQVLIDCNYDPNKAMVENRDNTVRTYYRLIRVLDEME